MQYGERDIDIDRGGGKFLRNEGDGCFNLCRDFSGCSIPLFNFRDIPLPFLLPTLQPRSVDRAKFLVYNLGQNATRLSKSHPYIYSRCARFPSSTEYVQHLGVDLMVFGLGVNLK